MYRDAGLYTTPRPAVMVDGSSERTAGKRLGIARKTVSKMLIHTVPPGYQRKKAPVSRKLGPLVGIIATAK